MREIKFRGKVVEDTHTNHECIEAGSWVYGYLSNYNEIMVKMSAESGGVGSGIVIVPVEVDPKTVGQHAELKDKDGKDYYEGDIMVQFTELKNKHGNIEISESVPFKVVWADRRFQLDSGDDDPIEYLARAYMSGKIIGNIYDNPTLMKDYCENKGKRCKNIEKKKKSNTKLDKFREEMKQRAINRQKKEATKF
jgi:hypothetical protein